MNTTLGHKSCYKLVIHSLNLFAFFQWAFAHQSYRYPCCVVPTQYKKFMSFLLSQTIMEHNATNQEFLLQLKPYKVATTHQQITMALTFYSKHHTDLKHHYSYTACVRVTQLLWVESKFTISIKTKLS
jgi:hypothetical protein